MIAFVKHKTSADLAAQYGVSLRSLSHYEEVGLLRPILIGATRYYTAKDCIRIELILKGRRLGFSLTEIARLIEAQKPKRLS